MLKMAVFAPIPIARVNRAITVKPRALIIPRSAKRTSCHNPMRASSSSGSLTSQEKNCGRVHFSGQFSSEATTHRRNGLEHQVGRNAGQELFAGGTGCSKLNSG